MVRLVFVGRRNSLASAKMSSVAMSSVPMSSVEAIEGILALRDTFASASGYMLNYRDLAERSCIERLDGNPCIVFNCEGMLFDGLGLPECSCGGVLAKKYPIVFHGTKDLYGILASYGVMKEARNTADHKIGWFHSTNFETARWYARQMELGRSFWQPVLQINSKCWNRCKSWGYTKKPCKRYSVRKIYLVKHSWRQLACNEFGEL